MPHSFMQFWGSNAGPQALEACSLDNEFSPGPAEIIHYYLGPREETQEKLGLVMGTP